MGGAGTQPWGAVGCSTGLHPLGELRGAAWLQARGSSALLHALCIAPMAWCSQPPSLPSTVAARHARDGQGDATLPAQDSDGCHPLVCCFRPDESLRVLTSPWTAVWVKICSSWAGLLLYLWTLVAPLVLPDRDFS